VTANQQVMGVFVSTDAVEKIRERVLFPMVEAVFADADDLTPKKWT
jgi:hypothetical protein